MEGAEVIDMVCHMQLAVNLVFAPLRILHHYMVKNLPAVCSMSLALWTRQDEAMRDPTLKANSTKAKIKTLDRIKLKSSCLIE